jgi:hypothetical protein
MYLALMQGTKLDALRKPRVVKPVRTEGQERQRSRSQGPKVFRYSLRMSKDQRDFADVLQAAIDKWYESAEDFARKSGGVVSNSSVSRWLARKSVPSARKIELLAPLMHITPQRLMAICYPSTAGGKTVAVVAKEKPIHPLARELDRMIGADSVLDEDVRQLVEKLVDSVLAQYRRLLRARKAV